MKTITINLYSFNELSKEAKQKAIENFNNGAEYNWANDAMKSLEKFAEHFNSELSDWSIDFGNSSYSSVKFNIPESMEEINETELHSIIESMGTYDLETLKGNGDCKFTGYGGDEDCADGARIAYKKGERNVEKILQAGFKTWLKACQNDFEYQLSEESVAELCEANEYTFEDDGKMRIA